MIASPVEAFFWGRFGDKKTSKQGKAQGIKIVQIPDN